MEQQMYDIYFQKKTEYVAVFDIQEICKMHMQPLRKYLNNNKVDTLWSYYNMYERGVVVKCIL